MRVNKKTHLYRCELTSCDSYDSCAYGIPHVCKRSHNNHYCWRQRKGLTCVPSEHKTVYTRCNETQTCPDVRHCSFGIPQIRQKHYSDNQTCPYRRKTIIFVEYDMSLTSRTVENDYLKRMGY